MKCTKCNSQDLEYTVYFYVSSIWIKCNHCGHKEQKLQVKIEGGKW